MLITSGAQGLVIQSMCFRKAPTIDLAGGVFTAVIFKAFNENVGGPCFFLRPETNVAAAGP